MITSRVIAAAALLAASALTNGALAQQLGVTRNDLQRHDLSTPGREAIQTIVSIAQGVTAPRHSHPGEEVIYVLEGVLEYQLDGQPPVTLKAGDVLFIPAGVVHSAKNVGSGNGAELKPLVVRAK